MAANRSNYIISLIVATILLLALLERSMLFCQSLPEQNLCSGKDITLTTMADIRRTSADKCPIEVREAFDELAKLVVNQYDDDDDDAICSMNHAKRIGQYFRAHIHNHEQTANQRKRPPPLRILNRFAIAYGLEVARVCRETLVENLGRDLTCKQFAQLMQMKLPFLKLWSPVLDEMSRKPGNHPNLGCLTGIFALNMHLVNSITCKNDHPESAIVPAHFYGIFSRFESKHKLVLRLQNSVELFELQEICERHIRPTYEPLLSSQALLADLNLFNYNPSSSSDDNLERKESRWHGIVLLCESLKLVKFEEPIKGTAGARKWLDIVAATGGDSSKVRGERKNRNNQNTRLSDQIVKDDDKFQKAALEAHDTSVSKSISSSGGVVDELRDRLFRHGGKLFDMNMLHLKWKSSMIMEKLIEMATRQVDDGQQDMKQLELVKSKLQTLLESNEERKLLKYISEMVADKNPQLSKFAASFQILLISTRVALVSIATSNVDPLGRSYKLFGIN